METYGAEVVASPSLTTNYGRSVLAETPDNPGSLGMAISEAVEDAATRDDTKYALGSVLNHVLLHQTVIGQEAIEQMGMAGESPDVVIGCTGGGSNFAGLTFPFLGRNFREGAKHRIIAVEPEARRASRAASTPTTSATRPRWPRSPRCTRSATTSSRSRSTRGPALPRHVAPGQPAQGSRRHRGARVHQRSSFEAGVLFARAEGILPAPEPTHAIRVAIDEALAAKEAGEAGSSCSTCAATATSTCRRTSATSTGRSRTTSTRWRRSRLPWRSRRSGQRRSGGPSRSTAAAGDSSDWRA